MKRQELNTADFVNWLGGIRTLYARDGSSQTSNVKSLYICGNGNILVEYNDTTKYNGTVPEMAIQIYNGL